MEEYLSVIVEVRVSFTKEVRPWRGLERQIESDGSWRVKVPPLTSADTVKSKFVAFFLCFTIFVILSLKVTFVFLRQEDKDSPAVCQRTAAHNFPGCWISVSSWGAANENKQHLFDSIYGSYCVNILDDCNGSLNTFSDTKVKEEKLFSVETTSWLTLKHWRVSILCWLHHNNFSCSSLGFLLAA